jgi:hypothetical protein
LGLEQKLAAVPLARRRVDGISRGALFLAGGRMPDIGVMMTKSKKRSKKKPVLKLVHPMAGQPAIHFPPKKVSAFTRLMRRIFSS